MSEQQEVDVSAKEASQGVTVGPGKINFGGEIRGHYPGAKCVQFSGYMLHEEINKFFAENPNLLVVAVHFVNADDPNQPGSHVPVAFVFYTKILSDAEIQEFSEVQQEARRLIDERKAKRAEIEAEHTKKLSEAFDKEKAKKAEALKELERLAEIGRKCEKKHGKGK